MYYWPQLWVVESVQHQWFTWITQCSLQLWRENKYRSRLITTVRVFVQLSSFGPASSLSINKCFARLRLTMITALFDSFSAEVVRQLVKKKAAEFLQRTEQKQLLCMLIIIHKHITSSQRNSCRTDVFDLSFSFYIYYFLYRETCLSSMSYTSELHCMRWRQ